MTESIIIHTREITAEGLTLEHTLTTHTLTQLYMVLYIMESMYITLLSSCPLWPTTTATSKKSRTISRLFHLLLPMMLRNSMSQANLTILSQSIRKRSKRRAAKAKPKMMLRIS